MNQSRSGASPGAILLVLFLLYLFLLPVWPSYLAKKVGPLPAFNPQRILLFSLLALCMLQFAFDTKIAARISNVVAKNAGFFKILLAFYTARLASCLFSPAFFYSFNLLMWEVIELFGSALVACVVIRRIEDTKQIALVLTLGALVVATAAEAVVGAEVVAALGGRRS